jgi:hypothetical protein
MKFTPIHDSIRLDKGTLEQRTEGHQECLPMKMNFNFSRKLIMLKSPKNKKIYIEGVKQNERAKRKQTFVEGKQQAAEASGRKVH